MASISTKPISLSNTVQVVTANWTKIGDRFNAGNNDYVVIRPSVNINSSQNVRFRLVERLTISGSTVYTLPLETTSAPATLLDSQYFEYNTDAMQNLLFRANVKGLEWLELQVQAGTVGATGASVDSVQYSFVKEA